MKKDLPQYSLTIKKYRQEQDLSQQEISDLLDIPQQQWSEYERGFKKNLQPSFVSKFKKLSGIDLMDPSAAVPKRHEDSEVEKLKSENQAYSLVITELRNRLAFLEDLVKQLTGSREQPAQKKEREKVKAQRRR